jgi:hypothetical protein
MTLSKFFHFFNNALRTQMLNIFVLLNSFELTNNLLNIIIKIFNMFKSILLFLQLKIRDVLRALFNLIVIIEDLFLDIIQKGAFKVTFIWNELIYENFCEVSIERNIKVLYMLSPFKDRLCYPFIFFSFLIVSFIRLSSLTEIT